ncbi:hypothetical protein JRO89_XS03G0126300 [Xanthoceras sorbifolium]|uniref:S1 motif domain-containing protein n=1 Tax=Xanthoceras sorbifolium TaxID=99658 RepID=A0ABQ8I9R0_9ROSI|nr:hypothetical protein JRO89_XS03G0126300 [Xanthoceras sorbifolium]
MVVSEIVDSVKVVLELLDLVSLDMMNDEDCCRKEQQEDRSYCWKGSKEKNCWKRQQEKKNTAGKGNKEKILLEKAIIQADEENKKLIFSEKEADWTKYSERVNVGDIFAGRVGSVEDYGAFIHLCLPDGLYHLTGLVHVSEVSWDLVQDIRDVLNDGDEVRVKVMRVDSGKEKDEYLTGEIQESAKADKRYRHWKTENNLVMSWLLNSINADISENFLLYETAKEIWDAVHETFSTHDNTAEFAVEGILHDLRQETVSEVVHEESRRKVMLGSDSISTQPDGSALAVHGGKFNQPRKRPWERSRITLSIKQLEEDPLLESLGKVIPQDSSVGLDSSSTSFSSNIEPLPGLAAIFEELLQENGIDDIRITRQGFEKRVAPPIDRKFTLLARAGRQVQEIQLTTLLNQEGIKKALQRVLELVSAVGIYCNIRKMKSSDK